jgi:hypothetical protein
MLGVPKICMTFKNLRALDPLQSSHKKSYRLQGLGKFEIMMIYDMGTNINATFFSSENSLSGTISVAIKYLIA